MNKFIIELNDDMQSFDVSKRTSKDDLLIADSIEDDGSEIICRKEVKVTDAADVADLQKAKAMYKSGMIDSDQYRTAFFKKAISIAEKTNDVAGFKIESAKFCDDCIILTFRADMQKRCSDADETKACSIVHDALLKKGISSTFIDRPYCCVMIDNCNDATDAMCAAKDALASERICRSIALKGGCIIVIN